MKSVISFVLLIFSTIILAQHSDPASLGPLTGYLNGNNLVISFHTDGAIAGFITGVDIRGLWKGNNYIGDMTPMIGLELPIKDYTGDGKNDTIHTVIISRGPRSHQSEERDPHFNYFWGFNPIPGYFNANLLEAAVSTKPETWPSVWPDHPEYGSNVWNGLLGQGAIPNSLEAYFKIDDYWDTETNQRYGFLADNDDTLFTGNGIVASIRYVQLNNDLFDDAIYRVYDIQNISKHKYDKVVIGNITGSLMGGDGDSGDDLADYDRSLNVVFSWDADGIGNHGQKTGVLGEAVIQSPNGNKITSFDFFHLTVQPDMRNDEDLWKRMIPGSYEAVEPIPQDGDYMYGTGYFSLAPSETKRIVSVIAMGDTKSDVTQNIQLAEALWYSKFNFDSLISSISITNLDNYTVFTGNQNIYWKSVNNNGFVNIWFSSDIGKTWQIVDTNIVNYGSYTWNTSAFPDCPFGMLRIFIKDPSGKIYGYNQSGYFAINNLENGKPFVKINNPDLGSVITENIDLNIFAGDADNNNLQLKIYYSYDGGYTYDLINTKEILSDPSPQNVLINLVPLKNSDYFVIKLELTDGTNFSIDSTNIFSKYNEREAVNSQYIEKKAGMAQVALTLNIIDKTKLTGNEYLITFDDTSSSVQKYLSVFDLTKSISVFENSVFNPGIESRPFDGLSFISNDIFTKVDSSRSRWNNNVSKNFIYNFQRFSYSGYEGYRNPNDYRITYYDTIVDTSVNIRDYDSRLMSLSTKEINFTVHNIRTNNKIKVGYNVSGSLSTTQSIIFVDDVLGKEKVTWNLIIYYPAANTIPKAGDTLYLFTQKGLSIYDSIKIKSIPVSVKSGEDFPMKFSLDQNFPNPFNPVTKIRFAISEREKVVLKIYDLLGREIITLLNEEKPAGEYTAEFNASVLSSGIYFYQLKAGSFIQTKKMIVLR